MSLYGLDQQKEIAGPDEEGNTEEQVDTEFDAEAVVQQQCIGCHGGDLTGGMGPNLRGLSLSQDEVHDVIKNGAGMMPDFASLGDENIDVLAEYILSLK